MTQPLSGKEVAEKMAEVLSGVVVLADRDSLLVRPESLADAASFLKETHGLELDYLNNLTAVDWLDYIFEEHSFDNGRIKALGFEFKHPDASIGLANVRDWYRANKWLPPPPAES